MSPAVYGFVLGFLDTTGRPIYTTDGDGTIRLMGEPVYKSSTAFVAYAVNTVQAIYGDISKSFHYQNANFHSLESTES